MHVTPSRAAASASRGLRFGLHSATPQVGAEFAAPPSERRRQGWRPVTPLASARSSPCSQGVFQNAGPNLGARLSGRLHLDPQAARSEPKGRAPANLVFQAHSQGDCHAAERSEVVGASVFVGPSSFHKTCKSGRWRTRAWIFSRPAASMDRASQWRASSILPNLQA